MEDSAMVVLEITSGSEDAGLELVDKLLVGRVFVPSPPALGRFVGSGEGFFVKVGAISAVEG